MDNSVPILPVKNLAPLKPLYSLKDGKTTTPVYINDGLKELVRDLLARDEPTFREIARTAQVVSNFIQGKQVWQPNYWTGSWTIQPINRLDPNRITAINIMQFYCTSQIKMILNSNPDIEPYDEYKRKEYKDRVKKAKAVWNRYEKKFFTQWFSQQEALHAIITGWYGESVEYDNLAKGARVFKEVFGEKEVEISPGYSKCFNCGTEGGYKDFVSDDQYIPSCPDCASTEILPPEAPVTQTYNSVEGVQPIETGDLTLKLKSILNFRFNLKERAEDSSWSITRNVIPRRKLEYILGNNVIIPSSDYRSDVGLKALDEIQRAGNTLSGMRTANATLNKDEEIVLDKICLSAEDVAHIVNKEDTPTIDGTSIPKGTRLSDLSPDGKFTVYAVNDGSMILAIYPGVHHCYELSTGVYHMRWESGHGRGSEDTVEVQKRFNRFDAQTVKYLEAAATPAHTYVKGSVDRNHIKKIGYPNAVIPINQEVAQALGTTDLVRQIPVGNVSGNLFQYTYDILNQFRQLTSHVTDFTNAFPGVDNRTATGAQLAKTSADSIYAPMLLLRAETRCSTAKKTMAAYNKHFEGVGQYFSYGKTTGGQEIGGHVKGEDVDTDIEFTVMRNSEQPKTMYDRQADFVNMLSAAGQSGGYDMLKAQDPKLAQALLKAFDIDIDDDVYDTTVDVCEKRLDEALAMQDQFKEIQQMMGQKMGLEVPEPPLEFLLQGFSQPICVEEPNHELKAKWFSDYLDCPSGMEMTADQRAVVQLLVRTHYEMAMMQAGMMQAGMSQAGMMGQQPMIDQQNAQNSQAMDQQHQQAMQQQGVQHQQAMQQQGAQNQVDDRRRLEDRQNTVHDNKSEFQNAKALEQIKVKGRPKPAKKK
jgi:hypothetical protein